MFRVMQSAYSTFVSKLEESARVHLRRQLEASTSLFTLSNLMIRLEGAGAGPKVDTPSWQNLDLAGSQTEPQEDDDDSDDQDLRAPLSCSEPLVLFTYSLSLRYI